MRAYLSGEAFGDAGRTLVIEEGLTGPELSLLVVCNGDPDAARPLAPAQDFKRIGDGDTGPNTGGMGAYSPVPVGAAAGRRPGDGLARSCPRFAGSRTQGIDYRGVLYAGMMLTADGPKVIEYNVRFGDPEAQVVLPRFSSDFAELLHAAAAGKARSTPSSPPTRVSRSCSPPRAIPRHRAPATSSRGSTSTPAATSVTVFHAGTEAAMVTAS